MYFGTYIQFKFQMSGRSDTTRTLVISKRQGFVFFEHSCAVSFYPKERFTFGFVHEIISVHFFTSLTVNIIVKIKMNSLVLPHHFKLLSTRQY